jgi:aldehyde:ferredoxin oxidoreductase
MLDEYYALRGWNREGIPTTETLDKLDLVDVSKQLKKYDKLGMIK